jgi:hypothetical protein
MIGGAMKQNLAIVEFPSSDEVTKEAVREQLSRILESPVFSQSERLGRFLRFTIEMTLAGDGEQLKEYLIGTEVYDRKPPYHPSVDSIVRSEARRLRSKLKEYYESAGRNDSVFVYYRTGSYVPVFRHQRSRPALCIAADQTLSQVLREELIRKTDFFGTEQIQDVQIIFEGTLRISRLGPRSSVLKADASKRTRIQKPS